MLSYVEEVKMEREYLFDGLKQLGVRVYPSSANFLFFQCPVANLDQKLQTKGVLIRSFSAELRSHYRVSVGSRDENRNFLSSMEEIVNRELVR